MKSKHMILIPEEPQKVLVVNSDWQFITLFVMFMLVIKLIFLKFIFQLRLLDWQRSYKLTCNNRLKITYPFMVQFPMSIKAWAVSKKGKQFLISKKQNQSIKRIVLWVQQVYKQELYKHRQLVYKHRLRCKINSCYNNNVSLLIKYTNNYFHLNF